jgi:hypothetical protein
MSKSILPKVLHICNYLLSEMFGQVKLTGKRQITKSHGERL